MSELIEARVPDLGSDSGVPVIELLVKVGETVKKDQGLLTLESDKATMEVPSPVDGEITEIVAKLGDELSAGDLVARIRVSAAAPASAPPVPAAAPAPAPVPTKAAEAVKPAPVAAAVPAGRMANPADLTGMAVFLASSEADYIVAQTYNVDGGNWMS